MVRLVSPFGAIRNPAPTPTPTPTATPHPRRIRWRPECRQRPDISCQSVACAACGPRVRTLGPSADPTVAPPAARASNVLEGGGAVYSLPTGQALSQMALWLTPPPVGGSVGSAPAAPDTVPPCDCGSSLSPGPSHPMSPKAGPWVRNVVVVQSVMQELRMSDPKGYRRTVSIVRTPGTGWVFFDDVHHAGIPPSRTPLEGALHSALWYRQHLAGQIPVRLLTFDPRETRALAARVQEAAAAVQVVPLSGLLGPEWGAGAVPVAEERPDSHGAQYPPHLTPDQLADGLARRDLLVGVLRAVASTPGLAVVAPPPDELQAGGLAGLATRPPRLQPRHGWGHRRRGPARRPPTALSIPLRLPPPPPYP